MAHGTVLTNTMFQQSRLANYPKLSLTIKPNETLMTVPDNFAEETYFAPKGSLDRLLRDARFLSVLRTLKRVPRIMRWIEEACNRGCEICLNSYPEQRRISISLCGHTMCDACLQLAMGDKMKSVHCRMCRKEIVVVLILDRPNKFSALDNVKHFLLQDDTPVHDPSLKLDSLVSLWRLGKEYPITLKPGSVEPLPAWYSRIKDTKVASLNIPELSPMDVTYNLESQAVIQRMLSSLGMDEDPFQPGTCLEEGDLIDWDRVFRDEDCEQNANAQYSSSRPYHPTQALRGDVRMDSNFFSFDPSSHGPESPNSIGSAEDWENLSYESDSDSDVTSSSDEVYEDKGAKISLKLLIAQLPMNYKEKELSNCETTFISEGKSLKRRLECPQWIMRVQVIPVILDSKLDDLIQLD